MNSSPIVDLEIENEYKKIEKEINYRLFRQRYVNNIKSTLLAKFIKLSDIYNKKSLQIHVCLEAIIIYIINRLLKLTPNQFNDKFNPKNIDREFLQKTNHEGGDYYHFSIECSADVPKNKYVTDNVEKINATLESYYKVECFGQDDIDFKCHKYSEVLSRFHSFNDKTYEIPFSRLQNPTVYECVIAKKYAYLKHILLIKLCNDDYLMIIVMKNVSQPNYRKLWYDFLMTVDIEDIAATGIHTPSDNTIMLLPLMNNIESHYFNVHNIIEDMDDFKNFIFVNKDNKNRDIKDFDIQTTSKLRIINHSPIDDDDNDDYYNNNNSHYWTIDKPFLYLLLNKNFIIKTGGIYDAHIYNPYKLNDACVDYKLTLKVIREKF